MAERELPIGTVPKDPDNWPAVPSQPYLSRSPRTPSLLPIFTLSGHYLGRVEAAFGNESAASVLYVAVSEADRGAGQLVPLPLQHVVWEGETQLAVVLGYDYSSLRKEAITGYCCHSIGPFRPRT